MFLCLFYCCLLYFEPIGHANTTNSFKGTFDGGGYEIKNLTVNKGSSNYAGLFGRVLGATLKNIGLVDVTGKDYVGGLVGYQSGSATTNSYATGSVKGVDNTGGLVGHQYNSSVTNSYATGEVNGEDHAGGLVGGSSDSSVTNSYWDTQTTGRTSSAGGTGKATDDMKKQGTYTGWDFESIWTIESGQYPTLR